MISLIMWLKSSIFSSTVVSKAYQKFNNTVHFLNSWLINQLISMSLHIDTQNSFILFISYFCWIIILTFFFIELQIFNLKNVS